MWDLVLGGGFGAIMATAVGMAFWRGTGATWTEIVEEGPMWTLWLGLFLLIIGTVCR